MEDVHVRKPHMHEVSYSEHWDRNVHLISEHARLLNLPSEQLSRQYFQVQIAMRESHTYEEL